MKEKPTQEFYVSPQAEMIEVPMNAAICQTSTHTSGFEDGGEISSEWK